jgi:flagellar biosynthesis protein FlhG
MADQAQRLREMFRGQEDFSFPRRTDSSRVIAVASGKGGVGKTNLVVNLAIVMGQLGNKVVILDTDLGMANVDILFNLRHSYSLVDVLKGHKDLSEVVLEGPYNVKVIPGGSSLPEIVEMDHQQRERLLSQFSNLEEEGRIILIDCPAGLSRNVLSFVAAANDLLLVTTPEPTAIADAYSIVKVMDQYKLHANISLVVNMVRSVKQGEGVYRRFKNVSRSYLNTNIDFWGSVLFDEHVHKAVLNSFPFVLQYPRSQATRHVREIARHLLNVKEGVAEPPTKRGGGFLSRLLQLWS